MHDFDPGPVAEPFATLARGYPGADTYPPDAFRIEWGPIFHRGRLDGSAKVVAIGQDPAQHEAIARRCLVGEAGQRAQAFLDRLGIDRSYAFVNTFLYSVYGQAGGTHHRNDPAIVAYRNRWLDALLVDSSVQAVIAFGSLADDAFAKWKTTPSGAASTIAYVHVTHPTAPQNAAAGAKQQATRNLLHNWNQALQTIKPAITSPDSNRPLVLFDEGAARIPNVAIPEADLGPGMPAWMRSIDPWAARTGTTTDTKRATITVTVPAADRPWH